MSFLKKLHDTLFEDKEHVPPPPAPGPHTPAQSAPSVPDTQSPPPIEQAKPSLSQKSTPSIPKYTPQPLNQRVEQAPQDDAAKKAHLPPPLEVDTKDIPVSLPRQQDSTHPEPVQSSAHTNSSATPTPPSQEPPTPLTSAPRTEKTKPIISSKTTQKPKQEAPQINTHPAHETPFFSQAPVLTGESSAVSQGAHIKPQESTTDTNAHTDNKAIHDATDTSQQQARSADKQEPKEKQSTSVNTTVKQPPTFHLSDGRVVAGPTSLAIIAQDMPEEVFFHHVTDDRNDFADWIQDGLHNPELANKVRTATTPQDLAKVLSGHHLQERTPTKPLPELATPTHQQESDDSQGVDVHTLKQSFAEITSQAEKITSMQESLNGQKELLEERENALIAREEAFNKSMELFEKEREQTLKALKETSRLRDELRKKHVELTQLQLSLQAHQDRLVVSQEQANKEKALSHDVRKDSFSEVAKASPKLTHDSPTPDAHTVLDAVEQAHRALVKNDVFQARELYSQARELFYATNIPEHERRELYNLIRELYTDIELSKIS